MEELLRQKALESARIITPHSEKEKEKWEKKVEDDEDSDPDVATPKNKESSEILRALDLLTQNQASTQQIALELTKAQNANSKAKAISENLPPHAQLIFK